jgi:hypothetical protein
VPAIAEQARAYEAGRRDAATGQATISLSDLADERTVVISRADIPNH